MSSEILYSMWIGYAFLPNLKYFIGPYFVTSPCLVTWMKIIFLQIGSCHIPLEIPSMLIQNLIRNRVSKWSSPVIITFFFGHVTNFKPQCLSRTPCLVVDFNAIFNPHYESFQPLCGMAIFGELLFSSSDDMSRDVIKNGRMKYFNFVKNGHPQTRPVE